MRWYLLTLILLGVSILISSQYASLHQDLWWDSHVYIAQGKYLFSGGELGLWEVFRPPMWSIVLGTIWLLGIQPIHIIPQLTIFLHTISVALLCYLGFLQRKPHIGILAGLYTAISPVLLLHIGLGLTESLLIPLCTLFMITVYKNKWTTSSILIGLAFLTKFTAGLLIVPYLAYVYYKDKKSVLKAAVPAASILLLYLLIHWIIFSDPFIALTKAKWIVTTQTELYTNDPFFYITMLLVPIHLGLLVPVSAYHTFLSSTVIMYTLYHSSLPRKEARYLAIIIPFLAYTLYSGYDKLRGTKITVPAFIILMSILTWHTVLDMDQFQQATPTNNHTIILAEYLDTEYPNRAVLSSNPRLTSYTDRRVIPMGHQSETFDIMRWQAGNYDLIYYNNCDFPVETRELYDRFTQGELIYTWNNTNVYTGEVYQTMCTAYLWDLNNVTS